MSHEPVFILVPKEEAKNSFDARRLVVLEIRDRIKESYPPPYPRIGGDFSGLLSGLCDNKPIKPIIPYYNKEIRNSAKEISKSVPYLKEVIERGKHKSAVAKASDVKRSIPELEKYNDADILAALRLELVPIGLTVDLVWTFRDEIAYKFTKITPHMITPDLLENGRDTSLELGYEDDAMIVDDCLYREVIDKMKGKIIYIDDIGKEILALASRGRLKEIRPEDVIGKKWIVLVDYID